MRSRLVPMSKFDPSRLAMVHDKLDDKMLEWSPLWEAHYRAFAFPSPDGSIAWNGLELDGWAPLLGAGQSEGRE